MSRSLLAALTTFVLVCAQPGSNNVSDAALDCAVRGAALAFARHLQPLRALDDVFDALQLGTYCGQAPPPPPPSARSAAAPPLRATSIFFSDALHGDDGAAGTLAAPFRTIARGVSACRAVAAPPCALLLRGSGPFHLNSTLLLDARDSGLTIAAAPGESAVVSGGTPLEGAAWTVVDVAPPANVWRTTLAPSLAVPRALLIAGRRSPRARWPNGDAERDILPKGYAAATGWAPPRQPATPPVPVKGNWSRPEDVYFPTYIWAEGGAATSNFEPPEGYWIAAAPTAGVTWAVPSALEFSRASFSPRVSNWSAPQRAVVFAFHGEYWGSWAFSVGGVALNADNGTLALAAGGWQEARGWKTGGGFYVDNVREELDAPGEWFFDEDTRELFFWHNETSGTPPPSVGAGVPIVAQLETLVRIAGAPGAPAADVTLGPGLTLTATQPTFLRPFRAPSGGDWSYSALAAVELTRTARAAVTGCTLVALGGNGILLADGNEAAAVTDSDFNGLGESAVVAVGAAGGGQAPPLINSPVGTVVARNVFTNLGIFVKQAGAVYIALAANTTVTGNIAFNLPRAAVNFNDGAFGGNELSKNLFFRTVRETADHGSINTWEREPYFRGFDASGAPVLYGALSRCTANFLLNDGYGIHPLDHDDGSNAWLDERNVLAWAGIKNWQGLNKTASRNLIVRPDYCPACKAGGSSNVGPGGVPLPTSYYFPACVRSLGQARWGALADTYESNTCILATTTPFIYGTCNASAPSAAGDVPRARNNTYFTPFARVDIACGGKTLSLAEAQAVGYELGSRALDNELTPKAMVAMIESLLNYSSGTLRERA